MDGVSPTDEQDRPDIHAFGETEPDPAGHDSRAAAARSGAEALVGRTAELAVLDRLIDDARHGHGSALMVSGEPGIGKTALLDALRSRVAAGDGRVLWGRATASGRPTDRWPTR